MRARIEREAEVGFGRSADAYERGRPGYPDAAVAVLVRELRLGPGTTVVDVGAGTGKLTRRLVPTGAEVVAVEPVTGMRDRLVAAVPQARALDGTAEALPLPDAAAGAVVAGQAFHWFASHAALAEFARVLGPGGRLGLVWNSRADTGAAGEISALLAEHQGDVPRYRTGGWQRAFDHQPWFGPLGHAAVDHEHTLPLDATVDRFASISFVAAMPDAPRAALLARIRAVLERIADPDGTVTTPYRTDVWWADRR